jgi:hypothetical protein
VLKYYSKIPLIMHLIIWQLRKVLIFTRKTPQSIKQGNHSDMFKKASKSVCTPTTMVSPDNLSPTPSTSSTSSAVNTPENTEEDPDSPKPAN